MAGVDAVLGYRNGTSVLGGFVPEFGDHRRRAFTGRGPKERFESRPPYGRRISGACPDAV